MADNAQNSNTPMPTMSDFDRVLQEFIQSRQQGTQPTQNQSTQSTPQSQPQVLHPIQQAALDGAVKATKEQSYQAVQQGGPSVAQHIVDVFGGGNPASGTSGAWTSDKFGSSPNWNQMQQSDQPQPSSISQPNSTSQSNPTISDYTKPQSNIIQGSTTQPLSQALTKSSPSNKSSSQNQQSSQPNIQNKKPMSVKDYISNVNQQASLNVAKRNLQASEPPNWMERFSQNFTKMTGGVTQADQLANMQTMQKIAGSEPIQPETVANLNKDTYVAAIGATKDAISTIGQTIAPLTDLYGKLNETKGRINQMFNTPSDEQKQVLGSLREKVKSLNTHIGNLDTLGTNKPTFTSQGTNPQSTNPQAQDINNKIQQKKIGKYTLVNSK